MKLAEDQGQTLDGFIVDALHARVANLAPVDSEAMVSAE
jgi:hypothetical protein